MFKSDFFYTETTKEGPVTRRRPVFEMLRVQNLALREDPDASDLEIAMALTALLHTDMELAADHGSPTWMTDDESAVALRSLRAALRRLDIDFTPPFRDFRSLRRIWARNGEDTPFARHGMLDDIFEPVHQALDDRDVASLSINLVRPITPHSGVGWPQVDAAIDEMRKHFAAARTGQEYSNVGNDAVAVLEELSRTLYRHEAHGQPGEPEPPVDQTKTRLDSFITVAMPGKENAGLRRLARAAIEAAQARKHRRTDDRRSAGVTADTVLMLAHLLRRIDAP
jgi:hypothetical protein